MYLALVHVVIIVYVRQSKPGPRDHVMEITVVVVYVKVIK